jgi:hypothetical protein
MNETTVELDPGVEARGGLIEGGRPADCVELSELIRWFRR